MEELMLPCMNKSLFGIECPGCGTQRALNLLAHFEFAGAFRMFPAIYTTILLFVLLALHVLDKRRSYQKAIIVIAIANAFIMVGSYLFRIGGVL